MGRFSIFADLQQEDSMAVQGWIHEASPFHRGEQAVQARLGAAERMDGIGRRVIRDFMPDQHREFYSQLPFVLIGSIDSEGNPWASVMAGQPGFFSSPDERTLRVHGQPLAGDPLLSNLGVGVDIGFLGIELHNRRRNRVNGVITAVDDQGLEVRVKQSFGNCPKYIQARSLDMSRWNSSSPTTQELFTLSEVIQSQIQQADTFFIATSYSDATSELASGVDVSHRGGKPGFIRIDGDTLTVPDFTGNCLFNTFGNIELNPKAGLLFIDFASGDLLYLTGRAEVIWAGVEISAYPGAERLLRFDLLRGYHINAGFPTQSVDYELSPFLSETGDWR